MLQKLKGERRYQVPRELACSMAFRSLPPVAKLLWHDLMMQYYGSNNGNINATLSELKYYNWKSSTTIARGLRYLIAHGLLIETRIGGKRAGNLKQCCLYGFTHLPIHADTKLGIQGKEPSYDYRYFDPKKNLVEENLTLQKMGCINPHTDACSSRKWIQEASVASINEVRKDRTDPVNNPPIKMFS